MKRKYLIFGISALMLLIAIAFVFNLYKTESKVCFGRDCFYVEIADSVEERALGLMFRENLEENGGMLFTFEESGIYPFWMKNTKTPLDMIWIDENFSVVFVAKNVLPCLNEPCSLINPQTNAKFVLEINANLSEKLGIDVGDVAEIRN